MEFLFKCLCLVTFSHVVSSELSDDVVFDILSRRLDHISITLSRIARKQKIIETRLNENSANKNDCCKEQQRESWTDLDSNASELNEEFAIMKRAFSTEKDFVRNLEKDLKRKMETTGVAKATPQNDLERRVEMLEKEVADDKVVSNSLERKMKSMEEGLHSVESVSDGLVDRIASAEEKLDSVRATTNDFGNRMDSAESSVSSLILASARKVSFSAQYRSPKEGFAAVFPKQRSIPFNHVFYNEGDGYNATTGIFTVPVSGVYQFIFFVEGWQEGSEFSCLAAAVLLYVDGRSTNVVAVAEPRHAYQHVQAGNAYINYFSKGQQVLVGTAGTCNTYTISGYKTSFHGVLLY